jgi:hypothetical protein
MSTGFDEARRWGVDEIDEQTQRELSLGQRLVNELGQAIAAETQIAPHRVMLLDCEKPPLREYMVEFTAYETIGVAFYPGGAIQQPEPVPRATVYDKASDRMVFDLTVE